jgi:hypothetical protein
MVVRICRLKRRKMDTYSSKIQINRPSIYDYKHNSRKEISKIRMNFAEKVGINLLEIHYIMIIRKIKNYILPRNKAINVLGRGNIRIMNSTKR